MWKILAYRGKSREYSRNQDSGKMLWNVGVRKIGKLWLNLKGYFSKKLQSHNRMNEKRSINKEKTLESYIWVSFNLCEQLSLVRRIRAFKG